MNVHLIALGGDLWTDKLRLRDYLRSHADTAARYAEAKRAAASRYPSLLAYSAAKADVVPSLHTEARTHAGR